MFCATITVWAVIPAQVVSPETTAPWTSETQLTASHLADLHQDNQIFQKGCFSAAAASSEEPDPHVVRASQGAPLTDEENIHLLGANYWVQPIYQELLHAASRHNVSVEEERKAKQRRDKTRAPGVDTAYVSDWIGGLSSQLSNDLAPCALGSAGDSGIKKKRQFFFEQCCARHYNCGSHEAVLK